MPEAAEAPPPPDAKKKKKDKVRSAWISFMGRIVAQMVGAAATVTLGLVVVHKYSSRDTERSDPPAQAQTHPVATRVRRPGGTALAVLPLQNLSGNREDAYFADGVTEALITDLAQMENLRVISRTSSMQYKDQHKPLTEIARELDVDLVLEGSVVRSGDRVRVSAQLIDANTDEHLWARSFDRTVRDVLVLQADVATEVAKEINLTLNAATKAHFADRKVIDPLAYELYLKGRQAWNLRTEAGFREALKLFDAATQKDPNFALAYAGLADTYTLLGPYNMSGFSPQEIVKARAAAERALQLDEHLGEAHTSLAAVYHRVDANVAAAEREFTRALELSPGYGTANQWYAVMLAEERRDEDALRHAQRAVTLDPLSGTMHQTLALVHYYARRYDEATTAARRARELAPQLTLARAILARSLLLQGKNADVIDIYKQAGAGADADLISTASVAFRRAGQRDRADALLQALVNARPLPAGSLAKYYALSDNKEAAYRTLERLLASSMSLQQVKSDPAFDAMRGDARFVALVQRRLSR